MAYRKRKPIIPLTAFLLLLVFAPIAFFVSKNATKTEAAWFNDSFSYRQAINITSHTAAENNVYISVTIDTSAAGQFKANCGDLRFTDQNGNLLQYYISSGCTTATTAINVQLPSFPAGAQTIYYYYGNPSAVNGFSGSDFSTAATSYVIGTIAAQEVGSAAIGYWKFDEGFGTTTKSSTSVPGLNGAIGTNASWKSEDQCISGKCLYIDDSGSSTWQTVTVDDQASLGNMPALTVGVWIKTASNKANQQIVYKRQSNGTPAWASFRVEVNNLLPSFFVTNASGTQVSAIADSPIEQNIWYYLTGVYNGSQVQIYVNAAPADATPASLTGNVLDSDYRLQIGGLDTASSYYFKGFIDEVKIYPYARTLAQIKTDFASRGAASTKGSSVQIGASSNNNDSLVSGLAAYWKFDESSGNFADSSGNGNTSTVTGSSNYGPGKFGNAFRAGAVATNLVTNPSYEVGTTGWVSVFGTNTRITSDYKCGTASMKSDFVAVSGSGNRYSLTGITPSTNYTISGWFKTTTANSSFIFVWDKTAGQGSMGVAIPNTAGVWTYVTVSGTTTVDATGPAYIDAPRNSLDTTTAYSDCIQLEVGAAATPYLDGSLGTGFSWSGTAHASTSTRAASSGTVANSASIEIVGNQITYSAWINPTLLPTTYAVIFQRLGYTAGYRMMLRSNGKIYASIGELAGGVLTSTGAIPINTWSHVAMAYDGKYMRIYINGVLDSSLAYTNNLITASTIIFGTTEYPALTGLVDEVRIYNRGLSLDEINHLYNYTPGPVAYWNFEEGSGTKLNDVSGNNNSSSSFAGTPAWLVGKYGKSLRFNGTADNVVVPLINPSSITVSGWVYHESLDATNADAIFGGWLWDPNAQLRQGYDLRFYINQLGINWVVETTDGTTVTEKQLTSANVPLNTWTYITGTYDSRSGIASLYINGVLSGSTAANPGNIIVPQSTYTDMRIGYSRINSGYLTGSVDDLKIYNYARTSGQIIQDMNAGHPLGGSPVGSQIGYWKFDEGYGTIANNSGSGGVSTTTTISGPSWSNDGKYNKALSFDSTDLVSSTLNYNSSTTFTLSAYIKPTSTSTFVDVIGTSFGNNLDSGITISTNNFCFHDYSTGTVDFNICTTSNPIVLNVWQHVALTYNNGAISLYYNGVLVQTGSFTKTNTAAATLIGGNAALLSSRVFNGLIDEVKVYNAALSADEIKLDYNRGSAMVLGSISDSSAITGGSIASSSATAAYCVPGSTDPCSPPVGEWNFEEGKNGTANDTSGNGNNGSITTPSWQSGINGKAINVTSTNSSASLGAAEFDTLTNATVEGFFYYTGTFDTNHALFGHFKDGTNRQPVFVGYPGGYGNKLVFENQVAGVNRAVTSNTTLTANTWYHFAITCGTGGMNMFLNGIKQTSTNATTDCFSTIAASASNYLGGDGAVASFQGKIDQFRVYDYVRTPAQIAWDYNQGKPLGWWKLDECSGTVANDSSGFGGNGSITIGGTGTQTTVGTCPTSGAWFNGVSGKLNSSLNFDGTDDYVALPLIITPLQTSTNGISYAAWIKTTQSTEGSIVGMDSGGGCTYFCNTGIQINLSSNAGKAVWVQYSVADGYRLVPSTSVINNGVWHHIVGLRKTDGTTQIYVDGKLENSGSMTSYYSIGTTRSNIGVGDLRNRQFFNGQIDDVRVYNYPLTPAQIKMIYTNGALNFGPTSGIPL